MAAKTSKRKFKSELSQILHIITHSLYSNTEIFLRELISNASDAIDKLRFEGLNDDALFENDKDWKIKIAVDKEAGTITVSDNGIGMSKESIIENLGTIARSGTRAFLESLQEAQDQDRPELIGQFGVGFYSSFMVADSVTVISRQAGLPADQAVKWTSDGESDYTIQEIEKESRGTDVILHLKEDAQEFLEDWRIKKIVKQFSDFVQHPIVMDVEREEEGEKIVEEETLNSQVALWLRDKSEVEADDYNQFYRQISNNFTDPAKVIHYTAEGFSEFTVLLFIPSSRPLEMQFGDMKYGPRLYINRVLIMDNCEQLLPSYLRFVKGVVDCPDLPLNVSREMLQENPLLHRIQKHVVKSVLKGLAELMDEDYEIYREFYGHLGEILKEGLAQDWDNREKIGDLLLFESINNSAGEVISLSQYVENMPEDQSEIYYLTGERRDLLENAPYLEVFKERGWDVLLLIDPIDEFVIPHLPEYQEKPLKAADDEKFESQSESEESGNAEQKEAYLPLLEALRQNLEGVKEVRLSSRLRTSASCIVNEEGAMSENMRRIMKKLNQQEMPESEKILELNPDHAVVIALKNIYEADSNDPKVQSYGQLLYDQAVIAEGSPLKNPAEFAQRVNELLIKDAEGNLS